MVFDSSTVITPSPPTFSIASATSSPIAGSLCAEIVATCAFSLRVLTGRDMLASASTAALRPRSRPRLRSIALAPATTLRTPSAKIAWARMVDGAGAVADRVAGLLRRLAQHLRAEVLLRVLEIESPWRWSRRHCRRAGVPHFFWISTDLDLGPA